MQNYIQTQILSVKLVDGKLEVITRTPSDISYTNGKPLPDFISKDIYEAEDGNIVLLESIKGKHTPAYTVAEKIEF